MFYVINPVTNPVIDFLKDKNPSDSPAILGTFFGAIIGFMLSIASIWSLIQFVRGAFLWIGSGGDKGKLEHAQQILLNAILGFVVLFASWSIFLILLRFFGIIGAGTDLNIDLPQLE